MKATEGLRKENAKLAKEADKAARKLKELGNVQNWAEVLERGFLVLEETVRLVKKEDSDSGSGSCTCSCSDCGNSRSGTPGPPEVDRMQVDNDDDLDHGVHENGVDLKGKGKMMDVDMEVAMVMGEHRAPIAWSDASRSVTDGEGGGGTETGKGSETASLSTNS